jgi:hypothetical protein
VIDRCFVSLNHVFRPQVPRCRTTERQFSRDIAPASGYLLASGRERLYTAADRGDTFRILRARDSIVSPETMKVTRPFNEWIQGT